MKDGVMTKTNELTTFGIEVEMLRAAGYEITETTAIKK